MLCEIKELLQKFDARATFFLCTDSVPGHEDALVDLIRAGSEMANHGCSDQPYGGLTESEFGAVFHRAENVCEVLRAKARGEELPELPELPESDVPEPAVQAAAAATAATAPLVEATNEAADAADAAVTADLPAEASSAASASSALSPLPGADASEASDASEGDPTVKRNWALGLSGLASGLARSPQRKAVEAEVPAVIPQSPYRWFRAPHADLSPNMQKVLSQNGFTNVLCDSFANDTQILDSSFIAETLLSLVDPRGGSIIVIHTPEPGFREHNFEALEILLQGLAERQLRAVTVH
mmetsp:Transcript_80065/g.132442  ORF Transcript_80065/g.132442 Transcript_80065/m.132442 type:complete len:298 (-) Transcript_80065:102-995(-)